MKSRTLKKAAAFLAAFALCMGAAGAFPDGSLPQLAMTASAEEDEAEINADNFPDIEVNAETLPDVEINEENFPDGDFMRRVKEYDKNRNKILERSEAGAVTTFTITNEQVSSLKGIEYFYNLKNLYCGYNCIEEMDLSYNTKLVELNCYINSLTTLDLSNNPDLKKLYCGSNDLKTIILGDKPVLEELVVDENELTGLEIVNAPMLNKLDCSDNSITSLDLSNAPNLKTLSCGSNKLTTLDLSVCPLLNQVGCGGNAALKKIKAGAGLRDLGCISCASLTEIDLTMVKELVYLRSSECALKSLDLSRFSSLYSIDLSKNALESLIIGSQPLLTYLYLEENNLTELNIGECPELETINISSNKLTSLDVSPFTNLTRLNCEENKLTSLTLGRNLDYVVCTYNMLETLDLTPAYALSHIYCGHNKLKSITARDNPYLLVLDCQYNQIVCYDLSGAPKKPSPYDIFNYYYIGKVSSYSLSNLSKYGFDPSKASNWRGAVCSGGTLTDIKGSVYYDYDCGNGYVAEGLCLQAYDPDDPDPDDPDPDPDPDPPGPTPPGPNLPSPADKPFTITDGDKSTNADSWGSVISSVSDPGKDYVICVNSDISLNKLNLPKKNKYRTLVITSENGSTLTVGKNISPAGAVTFRNIKLAAKKGKFGISAGKNPLTLENVITESGANIVSNDLTIIDCELAGSIKASPGTLTLKGSNKITASVKAAAVILDGSTDLTFVQHGRDKFSIGKGGVTGKKGDVINFRFVDSSGADVSGEFGAWEAEAAFEEQLRPVSAGAAFVLAGKKLIAAEDNDLYVLSYTNSSKDDVAVRFITSKDMSSYINDIGKNYAYYDYTATVKGNVNEKAFTAPAAGKYNKLTFRGEGIEGKVNTVTVTSDIKLTGNTEISGIVFSKDKKPVISLAVSGRDAYVDIAADVFAGKLGNVTSSDKNTVVRITGMSEINGKVNVRGRFVSDAVTLKDIKSGGFAVGTLEAGELSYNAAIGKNIKIDSLESSVSELTVELAKESNTEAGKTVLIAKTGMDISKLKIFIDGKEVTFTLNKDKVIYSSTAA